MPSKFSLYRRPNGTYYAHDCAIGARETLGTKIRAEAGKLLQAKNEAHAQPTLSRELAKVYVHAQDPDFGRGTWGDVARILMPPTKAASRVASRNLCGAPRCAGY